MKSTILTFFLFLLSEEKSNKYVCRECALIVSLMFSSSVRRTKIKAERYATEVFDIL